MAYNAGGRLRVEVGTPIYECNKICKCDKECTNRVVQKGRKVFIVFHKPIEIGYENISPFNRP